MSKKKFNGNIELDLVEIKLIEEETSGHETGSEISSDEAAPLLNELRSLAKVQFILCHSLPAVNSNGAAWTYPTLFNSYKTVQHQLVNRNHQLKDNQKLLQVKTDNVVIGHMIDADIKELEKDENGFYPLVPEQPVPVIVTAYLYKRVVSDLIARLKKGEKLKISMECEFTDVGFIYDGKMHTRIERPELIGQRAHNGKPVVRVLGGISPEGGIVNFWGAAVLDNQRPADENAEILSAVASSEIGDDHPLEYIQIQGEEVDVPNFLNRLTAETANLLQPLLEATIEDLTDENIAKAIIDQASRISELEAQISQLLSGGSETKTETSSQEETTPAKENAAIMGSLEDQIDKLREVIRNNLRQSGLVGREDFYIAGILPNSVIIELFEEGYGYRNYLIEYSVKEDGSMAFGQKQMVQMKQVVVPVDNDYASNEGDPEMPKEKEVAQVTQEEATTSPETAIEAPVEAQATDETSGEAAGESEAPEADAPAATEEAATPVVSEEVSSEEIASLKSRIEELVTKNIELEGELKSLRAEKAASQRKAVLASRKEVLAADFDLEELLDDSDEDMLATFSDEEFSAYAAKMKKIAAKFKSKTIDTRVSQDVDVVGGKPGEKGKPVGDAPPIDTSIKDDVKDANARGNKNIASSEEVDEDPAGEVATTETAVTPLSPETPSKPLANKFMRF